MRRRNYRCKACHKTAFPSEGRAEQALESIQRRHPSAPLKRAYPCEYGNGWHLTSKAWRSRSA